MKKPISNFRLLTISIIVALFLLNSQAKAQSLTLPPVSHGHFTPGGLLDTVFDRYGNKYSLGQIAINDTIRALANGTSIGGGSGFFFSHSDLSLPPDTSTGGSGFHPSYTPSPAGCTSTVMASCSSGYFQIYLDPASGMVDPTTCGPGVPGTPEGDRLAVLCRVLYDISNLIQSPCTVTGQKVNIWVTTATSSGGADATPFYYMPNSSASGIVDMATWITINSGHDAYENVAAPLTLFGGGVSGASFFHGAIQFNFGGSISWHTDLTTPPGPGEWDLYTVALHEMMHTLGFISNIEIDGRSEADYLNSGPTARNYQYYARFDTHLQAPNGDNLITSTGPTCSQGMYGCSFNPLLTPANVLAPGTNLSCTSETDYTNSVTAITYVGASTTQYVYTQDCFDPGGSLCHFDDQYTTYLPPAFTVSPSNNQYFVMSNESPFGPYSATTNPGAMKRYYKPEEESTLCDMGYSVTATFGDPTNANLNYFNYSSSCSGLGVVGICDGLSGGIFTYTSAGTPVPIPVSSLISNDYGAVDVSCVEVVIGTGFLTSSGGIYYYNPGLGESGVVLLRYLPVSATGSVGNITYVYVYVEDVACTTTGCDLVRNGGFENTNPYFAGGPWLGNVHCWDDIGAAAMYSRDVPWYPWCIPGGAWIPNAHIDPATGTTAGNDHFVGMIWNNDGISGPPYVCNAITQTLSSPLITGTSYTLSFWAFCDTGIGEIPAPVTFAISDGPTAIPPFLSALPSGMTSLYNFNLIQDAQWHPYTTTVVYTGTVTASQLTIIQSPWPGSYLPYSGNNIGIDDISIIPSASACTFSLSPTMCATDPPVNLPSFTCGTTGIFSWETIPVTVIGGIPTASVSNSASFSPADALAASIATGGTGDVNVSFDYTGPGGCAIRAVASTQISPVVIGNTYVCVGATSSLSDAIAGGTWSSTNTSVATIDGTGLVTGVSVGTSIITYTTSSCIGTITVSVVSSTPPITGITSLCNGSITQLSDAFAGGSWSASDVSVVDWGGTVPGFYGESVGTEVITYTTVCGSTTTTLTVTPSVDAITGPFQVCVGSSITLSDDIAGGSWNTNYPYTPPYIASIDPVTGDLNGISAGYSSITYSIGPTCYTTASITVNALPPSITGPSAVCSGSFIGLSDAIGGGVWNSSNTSIAYINYAFISSSGAGEATISDLAAGTALITYTLPTGCFITTTLQVNPLPDPIIGSSVCIGSTISLSDATAGGTWSNDNTAIATIDPTTGIVTGVGVGITNVTYTISTGCFITASFTVNALPTPISAPLDMCYGSSIYLNDAVGGGTWTSSNTSAATIDPSSGEIYGVSDGTTAITYTLSTGCITTTTITVDDPPGAIYGSTVVCTGSTITLSDAISGGTWSVDNTTLATIDPTTGILSGLSPGTIGVTYMLSNGCYSFENISVNAPPPAIVGPTEVCIGSYINLSDASVGGVGGVAIGTWSSSNTSVATLTSSFGVVGTVIETSLATVFGASGGVVTITYYENGCTTATTVTVTPFPITGPTTICIGTTGTLSNALSGGVWSSSTTTIATIDPSTGIYSGIGLGTSTITYTPVVGCYNTTVISVVPPPTGITGPTFVCDAATITLSDAVTGGIWSSDNTSIATIDQYSGSLTGVGLGTATITYSMASGCYSTATVTAISSGPPISGTTTLCAGLTTNLSDAASGGTWTSNNILVASIGLTTGVVTGVASGTANVTYTTPSGCTATTIITVNANQPITGPSSVCIGSPITLSDATSGGIWTSSNTSVATITSGSGIVSGLTAGATTITYTTPAGCFTTVIITVNPLPTTISGATNVCIGSTITLSDATVGGAWSSSTTTLATVGTGTGVVTGVSSGVVAITYAIGSCSATIYITVNTPPVAITGPTSVCAGSVITLSDATTGGTWSSGSTTATVAASTGVVTGVSTGTAIITYTSTTGCIATTTIIIHPSPTAIIGPSTTCIGSTITLSDAIGGGTWSSSNTTRATVGVGTGIVTGLTVGSVTITYTLAGGCYVTQSITVSALPSAITGPSSVCAGSTITLSDAVAGGTWSSSNNTVATINTSTRVVSGVSAGVVNITYILASGCEAVKTVTVNPMPSAITGPVSVCLGSTITLSNAVAGGIWSSSNTTIATIGSSSGVVTGVAVGAVYITYSIGGCIVYETIRVTAPLSTISSAATVCVGSTITLSYSPTGGTWASSNTTVATVVAATGAITGVSAGITIITYTLGGCQATCTVNVIVAPVCVCDYITAHPGAVVYELDPGLTGFLTATSVLPGTNYYLTHSVMVNTGTVIFTDDVVVMSPSVTVTVNSGANVELIHSHLFSCPGNMWQGMVLSNALGSGTGPTGRLVMTDNAAGSSMIEDANVGVDIPNPNITGYNPATSPVTALTLYTNGATFNKDIIGIRITNTPGNIVPVAGPPTGLYPGYPFVIENTVFTCRDFYTYTAGGNTWPKVWPRNNGTALVGALKGAITPATPYNPPYNIGAAYTPTLCNNGSPAQYGIDLQFVGALATTSGTTPGTEVYQSVVVGGAVATAGVTEMNLFDNLADGIYAVSSNLVCRNSSFMDMMLQQGMGDGIFSQRFPTSAIAGDKYQLDVYGNGNGYNNQFWHCVNDVQASDLYNVRGIYATMMSDRATSLEGQNGYMVESSNYYSIELNYNNIYNENIGINVDVEPPSYNVPFLLGQIYADYNTINATATGTASVTEFVDQAIAIQAVLTTTAGLTFVHGAEVNVDNNSLNYVKNGIWLTNFQNYWNAVTSNYNTIKLAQDLGATAGAGPQTGIRHDNNTPGYTSYNTITGPGYNTPAQGATYAIPVMEGVHIGAAPGDDVTCNTINDLNTGFFFGGTSGISSGTSAVYWVGNTMNANNFGYVLDGIIGDQPSAFLADVTGNEWLPATGFWPVVSGVCQTLSIGSNPLYSPMTVSNTLAQNPTINKFLSGGIRYSTSLGSIVLSTHLPAHCNAGSASTVHASYVVVKAAKKQLPFGFDPQYQNWIAQKATWQAMAIDTTMDTSAVLHAFRLMAQNSRYKYISDIANNIASGNYAAATALLGWGIDSMTNTDSSATTGAVLADTSAADSVVSNYRNYYQVLIKYKTGVLGSADSMQLETLANKCPYVDGSVIFEARALYMHVFNDVRTFNDLGCGSIGGGDPRLGDSGDSSSTGTRIPFDGTQNYTLSPNPSDGKITLKQSVVDNAPVAAQIWNSTGESIYKGQFSFAGGTTQFDMSSKVPGLYLLQLTDSRGNRFLIKFVINGK